MKRQIGILGLGLLLGGSALAAGEPSPLTDQKDKESYVIGYQYGVNLLNQGVRVNPQAFLFGLSQAQEGKPSVFSPEETKAIHRSLQVQVMAYRQQQYERDAEKNLEVGKAFLVENAKKEGTKTLPSGLQYKVLQEGSGPSPKPADTVTVNYRGRLVDGTEFDNSYKRGRPEAIDVESAIPGWKEALPLMKVGAKWQLFVPSELAYGGEDMRHIPPNSTLIFDLELVAIGETSAIRQIQPDQGAAPATGPGTPGR